MKEKKEITVGLFGTCGSSIWRDAFIEKYNQESINYFNPNKEDWAPEDAIIEAEHLSDDKIILFPITSETYGSGSLAESGFSVANALRFDDRRHIIVFVDPKLDQNLIDEDPVAAKESMRARALCIAHLKKLNIDTIHFAESLEEMLETSVKVHRALKILETI